MSSTSDTAWERWYKGHSFTENKGFATCLTRIKKKINKKINTDLSSLIVCFWKVRMRADFQAVHPRERRASELLSVSCGKNSSHKMSQGYTALGFNRAKWRAPCLNMRSATSAPKAYGKGGDTTKITEQPALHEEQRGKLLCTQTHQDSCWSYIHSG